MTCRFPLAPTLPLNTLKPPLFRLDADCDLSNYFKTRLNTDYDSNGNKENLRNLLWSEADWH
jgi:hypothetical protein